jgi:hypothetical protein
MLLHVTHDFSRTSRPWLARTEDSIKPPPPQSWQDTQFYLGAVWLGVWGPVWVLGFALYWRQRYKQPIKAHSPHLVMVTDTVLVTCMSL